MTLVVQEVAGLDVWQRNFALLPLPKNHFKIVYSTCDWMGKSNIFHHNFAIYILSWVTSLLSMSIYNSTISELHHFVMQPLKLPLVRPIKLSMCIFTIENYSKYWIFFADPSHLKSVYSTIYFSSTDWSLSCKMPLQRSMKSLCARTRKSTRAKVHVPGPTVTGTM